MGLHKGVMAAHVVAARGFVLNWLFSCSQIEINGGKLKEPTYARNIHMCTDMHIVQRSTLKGWLG